MDLSVTFRTPVLGLDLGHDPCDLPAQKTAHAAEPNRPDVLTRRWDWFEGQLDLEPKRLVFIDETWASGRVPGDGVAGR